MSGSWKTTGISIASLLALLAAAATQLLDGDPATNPDWNLLVPALVASLTGFFARDNNVTSEAAGAK